MPLVQTGILNNNITGAGPDGLSEASFGTVTVNGASSVVVTDTGYKLGDVVQFGLLTVGGTVGNLPHVVTGTNNVSFTVQGTASDTSVYNWIRFRPIAQQ